MSCNTCNQEEEQQPTCPDEIVCASYVSARDKNCAERVIPAKNKSVLSSNNGKWKASDGSADDPLFMALQKLQSSGGIVAITPEGLVGQIEGKDGDTLINIGGVWTPVPPGTIQLCFNEEQVGATKTGYIGVFDCGPEGKICLRKFTKPNCMLGTDKDGKIACREFKNCLDSTDKVTTGDAVIVGSSDGEGKFCFKYLEIPSDDKCYEFVIDDDKDLVVRERKGSARWTNNYPVNVLNKTITSSGSHTYDDNISLTNHINNSGKCPSAAILSFEVLNRGASRLQSFFDVSCQDIPVVYQYNYWFQSSNTPTKNYQQVIVPINSDGSIDVKTVTTGSLYVTGGYVKVDLLGFIY